MRAAQPIRDKEGVGRYLLDLTEANSIDSTMLGLLARIAKLANEQGAPPPTLVCPNEDIIDLGAEIGISTQKLHVRGPMGLEALTSERYILFGDGQVRK